MKNVFVDTDVILDFFFDRIPFSNDSAKILSMCEDNIISGFVTSVIVSNTYYILRKTASHKKVIDSLKQLLSILDVIITDKQIIEKALNSNFKDFEDAIQNYSAEKNDKIDFIITRNLKDYSYSNLKVVTPGNYLKLLKIK